MKNIRGETTISNGLDYALYARISLLFLDDSSYEPSHCSRADDNSENYRIS